MSKATDALLLDQQLCFSVYSTSLAAARSPSTSADSAAGESFTNRISGTPRMITRSGDRCHVSCAQFSCAQ